MTSVGSEKVWKMAETMDSESLPREPAKVLTMGSPKVALTLTMPAKALRKGPLKAGWRSMAWSKASGKVPETALKIAGGTASSKYGSDGGIFAEEGLLDEMVDGC